MKTDIEIAQEATLLPIKEVAANIGIKEDDLELYGKYKAKFDSHFMDEVKNNEDGKLVLVTAINQLQQEKERQQQVLGYLRH